MRKGIEGRLVLMELQHEEKVHLQHHRHPDAGEPKGAAPEAKAAIPISWS
jgi:hypothetical protein